MALEAENLDIATAVASDDAMLAVLLADDLEPPLRDAGEPPTSWDTTGFWDISGATWAAGAKIELTIAAMSGGATLAGIGAGVSFGAAALSGGATVIATNPARALTLTGGATVDAVAVGEGLEPYWDDGRPWDGPSFWDNEIIPQPPTLTIRLTDQTATIFEGFSYQFPADAFSDH